MPVSAVNPNQASLLVQRLTQMRDDLSGLEKQLGTGKRAETYGQLGGSRALDVALRARTAEVTAWQNTITHLDLRLNVVDTSLDRISQLASEVRNAADPNIYNVTTDGTTSAQNIAKGALAEMIGLMNGDIAGRYMFAGREVEAQPVEGLTTIMEGTATHAGFEQVADERRQADLGAAGTGRIDVARVGTLVTIDEDGSHPFGFKLTGATSGLSNATFTAPAGAPASMSVDFTGVPVPGEKVRIYVDLPDGTSMPMDLTASIDGSEPDSFAIAATAADTATNFEAAMTTLLSDYAGTALRSASSMQAAAEFFDTAGGTEPQRVDGPPFDTATAMRNGGADTVAWYTGDNTADDPRSSINARIDDTLSVNYGIRANEEGFSRVIQSLAAFSIETFAANDDADLSRYSELAQRVNTRLTNQDGVQSIETIRIELSTAHYMVNAAGERHTATNGTLTEMVEDIERVDIEEIAAKMLTLRTRLEASYQATAMLSEMSLTNFL